MNAPAAGEQTKTAACRPVVTVTIALSVAPVICGIARVVTNTFLMTWHTAVTVITVSHAVAVSTAALAVRTSIRMTCAAMVVATVRAVANVYAVPIAGMWWTVPVRTVMGKSAAVTLIVHTRKTTTKTKTS